MSSKQVGLRRTNPNIVLKTREITTKVKRKPNEPSLLQPEITPKRQVYFFFSPFFFFFHVIK